MYQTLCWREIPVRITLLMVLEIVMCYASWLLFIFIIKKKQIIIMKFLFSYSVGQHQSYTKRKEGQDLITSPSAVGICPQLRIMSGSVLIHLTCILDKLKELHAPGAKQGVALH